MIQLNKINKVIIPVGVVLSVAAYMSSNVTANIDDTHSCTTVAVERADKLFGNEASAKTTCIKHREDIKTVVAWNSANVHPNKNGLQVLNARNLMNDWEQTYKMKQGEDFEVAIVAYGKGARWALNDAAFKKKFGTENPSTKELQSLIKRGAKVYMCQNSMKGNGWKAADLAPGVNMVPSGVTALVDFKNQGYTYIAP